MHEEAAISEVSAPTTWNEVEQIADCSAAQILQIAKRVIPETGKLNDHSDSFLSFLAEKKVDGKMLMKYQRKQFGKDVMEFCGGNKKLNGPAMKLYKSLQEFDVSTMGSDNDVDASPVIDYSFVSLHFPRFVAFSKICSVFQDVQHFPRFLAISKNLTLSSLIYCSVATDIAPLSLEECTVQHVVQMLKNSDVFEQKEKLIPHKIKIIEFFVENKIDGIKFMEFDRKTFINGIAAYLDGAKVKDAVPIIWKLIRPQIEALVTRANESNIKQNGDDQKVRISSLDWDKVRALEDCGNRHLMFLTKEIMECRFSIDPEKPWKTRPEINDLLISWFEKEQMNGSMVKEYDRKQFGKDAVAFCDGNKKVNGVAIKFYGKLRAMDNEQMERFKNGITSNNNATKVCQN